MSGRAASSGAIPHTTSISGVVEELYRACAEHGEGHIALGELLDRIGRRSFGPLLLLLGLIGLAPISNIPGVVALVATLDVLVAGEMLIGMERVRIPGALTRRTIRAARAARVLGAARPFARRADRVVWPRLSFLTQGPFFYLLTLNCFLTALALPIIELIPLAGVIPNAAVVATALALTAHDGVWALIAFGFTGATVYLITLAI